MEQTPPSPKQAQFDWPTSLALAVAGEMVAPILLPASALLLVAQFSIRFAPLNGNLCEGNRAARTVYEHVAVTLASGQFIASRQ